MSKYSEVPVESFIKLLVASPPKNMTLRYKKNLIEAVDTRTGETRSYRRKLFADTLLEWSRGKHIRYRIFARAVADADRLTALNTVDVRALHAVFSLMSTKRKDFS